VVAVNVVFVLSALFLVWAVGRRVISHYRAGQPVPLEVAGMDRDRGYVLIMPFGDVMVARPSEPLRMVAMPIASPDIMTTDHVNVDVSAVAYATVVDAETSMADINRVAASIDQIADTALRTVVGQHSLDESLADGNDIAVHVADILDRQTRDWGVVVTSVEIDDIALPASADDALVVDDGEIVAAALTHPASTATAGRS